MNDPRQQKRRGDTIWHLYLNGFSITEIREIFKELSRSGVYNILIEKKRENHSDLVIEGEGV